MGQKFLYSLKALIDPLNQEIKSTKNEDEALAAAIDNAEVCSVACMSCSVRCLGGFPTRGDHRRPQRHSGHEEQALAACVDKVQIADGARLLPPHDAALPAYLRKSRGAVHKEHAGTAGIGAWPSIVVDTLLDCRKRASGRCP